MSTNTLTIPATTISASTHVEIDLDSLILLAKHASIGPVFRTEEQLRTDATDVAEKGKNTAVFAILHNGALIHAEAEGFSTFGDAVKAATMGVADGAGFRFAKRIQASTAEELAQFQAAVVPDVEKLEELLASGYQSAYDAYLAQHEGAGNSVRSVTLGELLIRYVPQFKKRGGGEELTQMMEFGTELVDNSELEEFEEMGVTSAIQFQTYRELKNEAEQAGHNSPLSYLAAQHLQELAPGQSTSFSQIVNQIQATLAKKQLGPPAAIPGIKELVADPLTICTICKGKPFVERYIFDKESTRITRRWFSKAEEKSAVLDVSNIAWINRSRAEGAHASCENVQLVVRALESLGFVHVIGIAEASLPYDLEDQRELESLGESLDLTIVAGNQSADPHILEVAEKRQAVIISNDRFREWIDRNQWAQANLERIRVPFQIADGQVTLDGKLSTKRKRRRVITRTVRT